MADKKMDELWSSLRDKDNVQGVHKKPSVADIKAEEAEKLRNADRKHGPDDRYTYDMVMVFRVGEKEKTVKVFDPEKKAAIDIPQDEYFKELTAECLNKMEKAGIKTDLYFSVQKDEIYCRLGVPEHRLEREADRVDYDLQLDHAKCLEYGTALGIRLAQVTGDPEAGVTNESWLNLFGKYKALDPKHAFRQELYKRYYTSEAEKTNPHYKSVFSSIDRLKLTVAIVEADEEVGGAGLSTSKYIKQANHPMAAFFALHENDKKDELMHKWFNLRSVFSNPLQEIRDYFGEAIAYYFGFLAFYNRALLIPAIGGIAFFIYQMVDARVDVDAVPAYAILVALWATIFLEFWKRKEAEFRIRWGMTKFLEKELPRPEFKGEWKPSPVDGRKTEIFPWTTKILRMVFSQSVVWTLIGVVIASVVGIFFIRIALVRADVSQSAAGIISAIINAIQIQILNQIYGRVSFALNEYENHRTDTEYMNALIAKSFLFKFVNSYNSMFYIAFFKRYSDFGCLNDDCLAELRIQLVTIFLTAIVISNFFEVFVPWAMSKYLDRANRQEIAPADGQGGKPQYAEKSGPEKEFEYSPYESTFDDFDELIIQYGFVTLFVVAFPLAPFLALVNNVFETRIDAFKVCQQTRRPEPRGAANIGTWFDILNIVSYIAVITNVAIVCWETNKMDEWTYGNEASKAYVFIISEHLILLAKFAISFFVPDEPQSYNIHIARQEYVVNVLINGMEEEPEDVVSDDSQAAPTKGAQYDWSRISEKIRQNTGHEW